MLTSFSLVIDVGILKEVFNSKEHSIFYCLKLCPSCLEFWNYPFILCMIWVWDPWSLCWKIVVVFTVFGVLFTTLTTFKSEIAYCMHRIHCSHLVSSSAVCLAG